MVRQRLPLRPQLWSQYNNNKAKLVVHESINMDCTASTLQRQQQRWRFTFVTFGQFIMQIGPTTGLLFFVTLMIWPGNDTSILRHLLLSKRSLNDKTEFSFNNIRNILTIATTTNKNKNQLPDTFIDSNAVNPLMDEKSIGLSARIEKPIFNDNSDLSIAFDGNKNQSQRACYRMKNDADIRQCYASHNFKAFSDSRCQSIESWGDVQHCLMKRYQYPTMNTISTHINEVHVIGERNSGTKFVTQFLQQCFPQTSGVRVHRDFKRSKHFFQPIYRSKDFTRSLVVVVVRDPIEWMAAMREYPYHSPSHMTGFKNSKVVPLPWQEFVNKTWTTEASIADRKLTAANRSEVSCTHGFRFDEVKPCLLTEDILSGPPWNIPKLRVRGFHPVYEQRRGKPYNHLLQMRSDKIVNWILQIPMLMEVGGFVVVRYEDLLSYGNEYFLKQVNAILTNEPIDSQQALPEHCPVIAAQPDRIGKRYIPADFKEWINKNLDVEAEHLIGYR